jgi:cytochrome P450
MTADDVRRDEGAEADQRLAGMLFSPDARDDPYPLYRTVEVPGCRHAAASAMLRDARLGPPLLDEPDTGEPMWVMFGRWLINLDGDRHTKMRQRFSRIFTPRRVEQYRTAIEARADELIDAVADDGRMDLVSAFARPLPYSIISTVLGVPEERHSWLAERMIALDVGFARRQEPSVIERASAAVEEMLAFFAGLLDERATDERDDLLSILAADMPDDPDGRADLLANCVFFIEAGHATTTSLISGATLLLLRNPVQEQRVRAHPELISSTVEEALRMVSPVSVVLCRAREAVEVQGYHFDRDELRLVFPPGANRDPDVFPAADDFDIGRSPNPHVAFSAGGHFCLGAPLARLHGDVALTALLRRLPDLRLDGEPEWLGSIPLRTPERLPLSWTTPARPSTR